MREMRNAERASRKGDIISIDAFRKRPTLTESHMSRQLSEFRLMLVRGERGMLLGFLRHSQESVQTMAGLLTDEYVGVGPAAADILREACLNGIDIKQAVPALVEALSDIYAKRNASAALAAYFLGRGDKKRLRELRGHEDKAVREAASPD